MNVIKVKSNNNEINKKGQKIRIILFKLKKRRKQGRNQEIRCIKMKLQAIRIRTMKLKININ